MNLIDKINERLRRERVKLTAITTAISIIATGTLPGISIQKKEDQKAQANVVIDTLVNNFEEETVSVETEIYGAKKQKTEIKKETKKEAINIGNYNGNSIVEALKKAGYDSSYASRKKIAKQYGIKNYDKSAEKNLELLKTLKKEAKKIKTESKKKEHDYKLKKEKYTNNEDGTHNIKKEYECEDCGKKKIKKSNNKKHKFDDEIVVLDDKTEIHTCKCGEEKKVDHLYTEWKDDKNGLTESRECKTCGHQMSRIKAVALEDLVENVDYVKTVTYKDNGDGTHEIRTKYKWLKSKGSLTIVTKSIHNEYGIWESLDDKKEGRKCSCGYIEERDHNYGEATNNGDGTENLTCKNCGHVMTRKKVQPITPSNPYIPSNPFIPTTPSTPGNSGGNSTTPDDTNNNKHKCNFIKDGEIYYEKTEKEHIAKQKYKCLDPTCKKTKVEIVKKENHIVVNWVPNENGKTESGPCDICGYIMTRDIQKGHEHNLVKIDEKIIVNKDGTHTIETIYKCTEDEEKKTDSKTEDCTYESTIVPSTEKDKHIKTVSCKVCDYIYEKEVELDCIPDGNIQTEIIDGVVYEYEICKDCGRKCNYRLHEKHTEVPEDLEYTFDHANGDGTHELTAKYNCGVCKEEIPVSKTEDCDYTNSKKTYEALPGGNFTVNNKHNVSQTCDVCGETNIKEEACNPTGDMQYAIFGAQTYEFYYCDDCGYRCQQVPHWSHNYGDYESEGEKGHKRDCPCGTSIVDGDRTIEEPHNLQLQGNDLVCDDCGYTKTNVPTHEHIGKDPDLMQLVAPPYMNELISFSQIMNPNPDANSYCSYYGLKCSTCGVTYRAEMSHMFEDGVEECKRNGCNMKNPNYGIDTTALEDINPEEFVEQLPITDIINVETSEEEAVVTTPSAIEIVGKEEVEITSPSALQAKTLVKTRTR